MRAYLPRLAPERNPSDISAVWNQPYLETCCRSALHRVVLSGAGGRPAGLKDGPCLERLAGRGLVCLGPDSRYVVTPDGVTRHASEIAARRR